MSAPGTSAAAAAAPAPAPPGPASAQQATPALSPQAVRALCLQAFPGPSAVCALRRCAVETLHAVQNGPCGPGSMLASEFRLKLQNAGGQAWNLCPSFEGSKVKSMLVGAEAVFKAKYVPGETSKAVILDLEGLQEVAADPSKCTEWTPSPAANSAPAPAPGPQPPMPGPSGKGGKPPVGMQVHMPPAHLGEGPGSRELSLVMMAMALYRPGTPAAPNEHLAALRCKLACLLARAADSPLGPHTALGTHLGDALGKYAPEAWQALPSAGSRLQRLADSCLVVDQAGGGLAMRLDVQELERQAQQAALQEWRSLGPLPGSGRKAPAGAAQQDGAGMAAAAGPALPPNIGLDPSGHLPPAKDDDFGLAIAAATISVWCPQKWHLAAAILAMLGQPGPVAMRNGGRTCSHVGFFLKEVQRIAATTRVPQAELSTKFLSASEPLLAFNSSGMPQGIVSLQAGSLAQAVLSAARAAAGGEVPAMRQPACWPPNVQDFPVGQLHQQAQPLARHLVHVLSGGDVVEARSQLMTRVLRQLEMIANAQQPQQAAPGVGAQGPAMALHPMQQQQAAAAAAAAAGLAVRAMAAQSQAGALQQRASLGAPGTPMQQPGSTLVQMPGGQLVALAPNQVAAASMHPGLMPPGKQGMPSMMPNPALLQQMNAQQQQTLGNTQQMLLAAQHAAMGMSVMQQPDPAPTQAQRLSQLLLAVYPHTNQDPASTLRKIAAVHLALAPNGPLGPQSMMLADLCRILRNEDINSWQALFGNQPESQILRDAVTLLHNAPGFALRAGGQFEVAAQLDVASLERAAGAAPSMGLPQGLPSGMLMGAGGLPQSGLQLAGAAAAAAAGTQAIQAAMQAQQHAQQQAQHQAQQQAQQQAMMQMGMQSMASIGSASSAGGGGNMGGLPSMAMRPSFMGGMAPAGAPGPQQPVASPSIAGSLQHSGSLAGQGNGAAGMQLNSMAPVFIPGQDSQARGSQQGNMPGSGTPSHVLMGAGTQTGMQGAPSVSSTTSSLAGGGGGGGGRPPGNGSNGSGNAEGGALPASLSPVYGGDNTYQLTTNRTDGAHLTTTPHSNTAVVGGLLHSLQAAIQAAGFDRSTPPITGARGPAAHTAGHLASKQSAPRNNEVPVRSNTGTDDDVDPAQLRLWAQQAFGGQDAVSVVRLAAVQLLSEVSMGPAGPYSMDGPALGLALAKQQPDAYRALPCSAQGKLRLKAVCDGCAVLERNHTHQTQVCIKLNITALREAAEASVNGPAPTISARSRSSHARAHSHGKLSTATDGSHSGRNTPGVPGPATQAIVAAAEVVYPTWEPMRELKLAAVRILASIGPDVPDGPRVRPLGNHSMMGPEFGNAMSRTVPAAWGSIAGSNKLAKLCSNDRYLEVGVAPSGDNRAIRLDADALLAAAAAAAVMDAPTTGLDMGAAAVEAIPAAPAPVCTAAPAAVIASMACLTPDMERPKSETATAAPRSPLLSNGVSAPDRAAFSMLNGTAAASTAASKTAPSTPRPGGILPPGSTMIGLNPAAHQYWPSSPVKVPQPELLVPERHSIASSHGSSSIISAPEGSKPSGSTPHTTTSRNSPFQPVDALEYARATVTATMAFEPIKGMLHPAACRASSGVGDEVLEGALRHQETALLHLIAE